MNPVRLLACIGCMAALFARAKAGERNAWPIYVAQKDLTGHVTAWQAAGPLLFEHPAAEGGTFSGFRPFFVRAKDISGRTTTAAVLYPVFIYRADGDTYRWTILNLITHFGPKPEGDPKQTDPTKGFDLWPFWFSRDTGSPATSYHALFPIAGTIKNRFGHDELNWVLWPLYLRTERNGAINTSTPWPFIQVASGTEHGFALWPLYGTRDHPDQFHRSFFLWPLGWNNTIQPTEDAPPGSEPTRQSGFIPFYTRETRPGYVNQDYLWPFFGYTDRTLPNHYHETRYLWPFLVQGRGDDRFVDRKAPFYTHSIIKGMDKTWVMWPLFRQAKWEDENIAQKRTQFLYLLYWSQEQRSLSNPNAAPADRTHVWPLFSKWDNGAGRKQFQLFSPLDVFFPSNDLIRENWTPLFAIYRSDQKAPDVRRWSLLWNAVTWRRDHNEKEFHLGPLLSVRSGGQQKRTAVGVGLFGWKREPGQDRSHFFVFDFPSKVKQVSSATR